eukprot:11094971-Alexandrium_andersonii.AAC.1
MSCRRAPACGQRRCRPRPPWPSPTPRPLSGPGGPERAPRSRSPRECPEPCSRLPSATRARPGSPGQCLSPADCSPAGRGPPTAARCFPSAMRCPPPGPRGRPPAAAPAASGPSPSAS